MKVLFIGAHIDDSDLMAGGTMAKFIESGYEVDVVTLSYVYEGINLSHEFTASMNVLKPSYFSFHNFPTRQFYQYQDQILQALFSMAKNNYDFVFIPEEDCHSDHTVVSKAAKRVFKHTNLLSYQPDWNSREFTKNYFIRLNDKHIQNKLEALRQYESQKNRKYFDEYYQIGALRVNGLMANCEYAEAFKVINLIS